MSATQTTYITISCDGPECNKTVTFLATEQGQAEAIQDNPWMTSLRGVSTVDQRKLNYCSDTCEAQAVAAGNHNKKVIVAANAQQADLATRAAEHARQFSQQARQGAAISLA